ncbi:major facilitator superfamily domain-containing protein [Mycena pura]|uniref:Major facilitator superfamily domain-containing protein n=1 Tax=Mycena pura TaxID=153505 RepID=A0AAD6VRX7_9AGAR|nr:major facilitator superfamily domain-containing protein [Mycena pura]
MANLEHQQPIDTPASDEQNTFATVNGKEHASPAESAPGPPPFPEGGREAWTVAFGAWLAVLVSFGFLNAFGGVFQQFYTVHQLAGTSSSSISWIGSFQIFWSIISSLGGSPTDPLIVIGGVGFALSCMFQSISTHYWHFLLSQGLLGGIALSCLFTPAYTAAQHWFLKRRGFALGMVTSGAAVGGVIWPILADRLIRDVGFGWALRTVGFISLALSLVSAVLVKGRLPPRTGKQVFAFDLFLKPGYTIFCLGMFFVTWGLFFLIFFLPSYRALHGFDANMTFYSVSVLNAASLFGRIVPGFLADRWGRFNMMVATALASAILTFASIAARNEASVLVIGVLYGFASGNVVSLQGACVPAFMDDPTKIGVAIGQLLSVSAFAVLTGPPILGALITNHGFWAAQIFAGLMLLAGSVLIFVARQSLSVPGKRWLV